MQPEPLKPQGERSLGSRIAAIETEIAEAEAALDRADSGDPSAVIATRRQLDSLRAKLEELERRRYEQALQDARSHLQESDPQAAGLDTANPDDDPDRALHM